MPADSHLPIAIAGTGRVAQALGRLLAEHGEPVAAVAGRDPERTRAAAVFIGHKVKPAALGTLPKRSRAPAHRRLRQRHSRSRPLDCRQPE